MKTCITCAYFKDNSRGSHYRCSRNDRSQVNPVTGETQEHDGELFCECERDIPVILDILNSSCGRRGRYWKARLKEAINAMG